MILRPCLYDPIRYNVRRRRHIRKAIQLKITDAVKVGYEGNAYTAPTSWLGLSPR